MLNDTDHACKELFTPAAELALEKSTQLFRNQRMLIFLKPEQLMTKFRLS